MSHSQVMSSSAQAAAAASSPYTLNGKSVLITGGTGSFGKAFVQEVLRQYPDVRRLIVYSRDELKQSEMEQIYPPEKYPCMRYFIGDVRDQERLRRACENVQVIIHAAALKQVPTAEYNPMECIRTNVIGAENVISVALDLGVNQVVALSTDKAAAPVNLYGATKLCSDKLFIAANNIVGARPLRFSVVRYGNVMGSRGSVIPFFMKVRETGRVPITHESMTRFNITLQEGVGFVLDALHMSFGGELFVPKLPSYRITDLAEAIAPGAHKEVVGIRPGEKLHEEMITETDSYSAYDCGKMYALLPTRKIFSLEDFIKLHSAKPVAEGFSYSSGANTEWLSVEQIRQLITEHLDPNFQPTPL